MPPQRAATSFRFLAFSCPTQVVGPPPLTPFSHPPHRYNWSLTGELHTRALCSSPSVYALSARRFEGRGVVVAAGGSADGVDIFMDTSHRAYTLML
eukprot:scaffold81391_cov44-Tisochrysis_lutea.AAC.2